MTDDQIKVLFVLTQQNMIDDVVFGKLLKTLASADQKEKALALVQASVTPKVNVDMLAERLLLVEKIETLQTRIDSDQKRLDVVLECLQGVIHQACSDGDGDVIDSQALSEYAYGMRLLSKYGRLTIKTDVKRRVIGYWTSNE